MRAGNFVENFPFFYIHNAKHNGVSPGVLGIRFNGTLLFIVSPFFLNWVEATVCKPLPKNSVGRLDALTHD